MGPPTNLSQLCRISILNRKWHVASVNFRTIRVYLKDVYAFKFLLFSLCVSGRRGELSYPRGNVSWWKPVLSVMGDSVRGEKCPGESVQFPVPLPNWYSLRLFEIQPITRQFYIVPGATLPWKLGPRYQIIAGMFTENRLELLVQLKFWNNINQ